MTTRKIIPDPDSFDKHKLLLVFNIPEDALEYGIIPNRDGSFSFYLEIGFPHNPKSINIGKSEYCILGRLNDFIQSSKIAINYTKFIAEMLSSDIYAPTAIVLIEKKDL